MKLVYFIYEDRRRVGILDGDEVFVAAWPQTLTSLIEMGVKPNRTAEHYPLDSVTLQAPLRPRKIFGIGRNYVEHASELGNEVPKSPLIFAKLTTSVIGTNEAITWSESMTTQVDWEGELAVVIGKRTRNVSEKDALKHVYGYCIANDISARDIQDSESQWVRAKGLDTFCPLGPWLVTADDVPDPHKLTITTTVNGEQMQHSATDLMIYKIPYLISYMSQSYTLEPGDVILTGTPAGVGKGRKPPQFLKDGDEVKVTIDGLGELINPCKVLE